MNRLSGRVLAAIALVVATICGVVAGVVAGQSCGPADCSAEHHPFRAGDQRSRSVHRRSAHH